MPKDISAADLKYYYMQNVTLLTGYVFSINSSDDTKFITNSVAVGAYSPLSIKRTPIRTEEGTVLNEIEIGLDNIDLSFKANVMAGKYNNKFCKIQNVFVEGTSIVATIDIYHGYIDEPKGDERWVTFQIRPFHILEREFPNRIFQVGCNWTFCDDYCNLSISSYQVNTSLSAQSDGVTLTCSHGQAANYFVPGYVQLTDGAYAGEYRPILSNSTSAIIVRIPFGHTIPNGTQLQAVKLCAKTPDACINTFGDNYDNYGGFPHVPKQPII